MKKIYSVIIACLIIAGFSSCKKDKTVNENVNGFEIQWSKDFQLKKDKDNVRKMLNDMVRVDGGEFMMGDTSDVSIPSESPIHSVVLSGFYINKYEVTQALWCSVMGSKGDWDKKYGLGDDYPAYRVSYKDVEAFVEKLNSVTGLHFCLPTEAQWEYAARGGKFTTYKIFAGSNNSEDVAWTNKNATMCSEIGKKNANELGLYDMSGNVWEMTRDWFSEYPETQVVDPECTEYGDGYKVFRGGSWNNIENQARVTTRYPQGIHYNDYETGFRLSVK